MYHKNLYLSNIESNIISARWTEGGQNRLIQFAKQASSSDKKTENYDERIHN